MRCAQSLVFTIAVPLMLAMMSGNAIGADCDADDNGVCTANDYVECRRRVLGISAPNGTLDLDRSGVLTARDCILLRHSVLGYRGVYTADYLDGLPVGARDVALEGENLAHAEAFLDGEPIADARRVDLPCSRDALGRDRYSVTTTYVVGGVTLPGDAIELRVDTGRTDDDCARQLEPSLADVGMSDPDAGVGDAGAGDQEVDAGAPAAVCGDGQLDPGEQCDDGNVEDLDGCSANCASEAVPDEANCGTEDIDRPDGGIQNPFRLCDEDLNFRDLHDNDTPLVVRVSIHIVRNRDGLDAIDAPRLAEMTDDAARYFAAGDIELQWTNRDDPDFIVSNADFNVTGRRHDVLLGINNAPDAIDVYIVNTLSVEGRDLCGVAADIGYDPERGDGSITRASCAGGTLAHEIGHSLGLWHTHSRFELEEGDCDFAGDMCCDTPPDPGRSAPMSGRAYCNNPRTPACESPVCVDADGSALDIEPDIFNLMSYYRCADDPDVGHLSHDQLTRARCYIVNQYEYAVQPCEPGERDDHLGCVEDELYWHNACNQPTDFVSVCLAGCEAGACLPDGCDGPADEPCGRCGTRSRTCIDERDWSEWGACENEGLCTPGATEACDSLGTMICTQQCGWSECDLCFGRPDLDVVRTEPWTECEDFSDSCDESGTRRRRVDRCRGGVPRNEIETEPCFRDTDGIRVEDGSWSECAGFDDACDEDGVRTRDNTVCRGGLPTEESEAENCSRETDDFDVFIGDWSVCSGFDGTCGEDGTRTRSRIICVDGQADETVESEPCTRETDGQLDTLGNWTPCAGFADACDESGQQQRPRRVCRNGVAADEPESRSCSRETDGQVIGSDGWSACDGFSHVCDQTGQRSRRRQICRNGRRVDEPQTESCSRNTEGQVIDPGSWSACDYSDSCDEQAERTRTVRRCRGGSERADIERDTCERNTDGNLVERGNWSACGSFAHTCDDTGTRRRTDRVCANGRVTNSTAVDQCSRDTDGESCPSSVSSGVCGAGICRQPFEVDGCNGNNYVSACARSCEGCRAENGFVGYNETGCGGLTCFNRFPNHGANGFVYMYTRANSQTAYSRWEFPAALRGRYRIRAELPSTTGLHEPVCGQWIVSSAATYNLKRGDATAASLVVNQSTNRGRWVTLFEGDLTHADAVTLGNRWPGSSGCGHVLVDRIRVEPI